MSSLTDAELEIMKVLWKHGTLKPTDFEQHLSRTWDNGTIRTILGILMEKGHVARERAGRGFAYRAVTRREGELRKMLRKVMDAYCGGSATELVHNLVQEENLSHDELAELRALLKGVPAKNDKGGKP